MTIQPFSSTLFLSFQFFFLLSTMGDEGETKEDVKAIDEKEVSQHTIAQKEEVQGLVSRSQWSQALKLAVGNPPNTKNDETKKIAAEAAALAIWSIPSGEVDKTIETLDVEELNNVMKYVYKGMALTGHTNHANLLNWHSKLVDKCGVGILMRAMVDRKV